jgi:hypothetical protein
MPNPTLSIVIAAVNADRTTRRCLSALAPQLTVAPIEVLVVSAAADAAIACEFPFVTWIPDAGDRLVPELWGKGIEHAHGRIIALTITACTPAPGWVDALINAHRAPHAAVGGPIASAPGARATDRAVYLVRYTPYMPPIASGLVEEVPGDNGSYKREAIADRMEEIVTHGFWEADINRQLRLRGATLWMESAALVVHAESFSFIGFSRQRFAHGRRFGVTSRTAMPQAARWAHVAGAPLVPLVMLGRILRRVIRQRRQRPAWLVCIPIVLWFLVCWSAGECVGLARD